MSIDVSMQFGKPGGVTQSGSGGGGGGGITATLLWENPNPATAFAAQSISLDLSGYDFFAICLRWSVTNDEEVFTQIYMVNDNPKGLVMVSYQSNANAGRKITYSTTNKTLTFGASYASGSVNANAAIPQKIYGIKL